MNIELLERELIRDEGWRSNVYRCKNGHLTIGVGHKLMPNEMHITEMDSELIWIHLRNDVMLALAGCEMIFGRSKFGSFSDVRQRALVNMCFQMGTGRLSGFQRMIAAIFKGDWLQASIEALDSKWARKDSPTRARRVAEMIRTGTETKEVRA